MVQSQVKPSHCCRHTPWLAQDSSVQVVLGPGKSKEEKRPGISHIPRGCRSSTARQRLCPWSIKPEGPDTDAVLGWDGNRTFKDCQVWDQRSG